MIEYTPVKIDLSVLDERQRIMNEIRRMFCFRTITPPPQNSDLVAREHAASERAASGKPANTRDRHRPLTVP